MKNSLKCVAAAVGMLAAGPAFAADNWALQIIEDAKAAEKPAARASVRVASLGDTEIDISAAPARPKRSAATAAEDRPQQTRRTRTASLGTTRSDASEPREKPRRSLSGGSINWLADSGCLNGTLRSIVASLASNYGPVTINSTCRSKSHNRSVGGAPKSYHLDGDAVDFRIHSNVSAAYASLRSNGSVGGLKHYGGGLFHIDTGPRRSW
jgi:hypothetical protein